MRPILAVAVAVILVHLLLAGSEVDLGPIFAPASAALLLAGLGFGLLARSRIPFLSDTVALALLVPLRGPLCDLVFLVGPNGVPTAAVAAALSLVPVGFFLGRRVSGLMRGGFTGPLLGVVLGEALVVVGAAGWMTAWIAGPVAAMVLALLAEWTGEERGESEPERAAVHALPVGVALGLLAPAFARLVPAYVEPSAHVGADVRWALLLPALLVAWPASVLAGRGRGARWLGLFAGLLLAAAIVHTSKSLGLYQNAMAHVGLARSFRGYASQYAPYVTEWGAWLLSFAGLVAAGLGLTLGALRARSVGWLVMGAALGAGAQYWVLRDPVLGPFELVLAAAGAAAVSAPLALLPRLGWLGLPLAVVPFVLVPILDRPGFDEVRRPGEFGVDAFHRTLGGDITVFMTPGLDSNAVEGREAARLTFTDREPLFSLDEHGDFVSTMVEEHHDHFGAEDEPEPEAPETFYGMRFGGAGVHAGHTPTGAEGSLGRLTRFLAVPGSAFVTGFGAELLAADLYDAGLSEEMTVSSPAPFGRQFTLLLLDRLGSSGWNATQVGDPVLAARGAEPGAYATVVVSPTRDAWPGGRALSSREHVGRLARLLAPGGRCLLWLDTQGMSVRALRSRIAAFARVFGEDSAAFVEPRELDAPFALLVGWRDAGGRPRRDALSARLPWPDETGLRTRLTGVEDLGAILLRDGEGMLRAADEWPVAGRSRPVGSHLSSLGGWAAVRAAWHPRSRLAGVIEGTSEREHDVEALMAGLATHARYTYRLEGLNETLLEIKHDVDWALYDEEVEQYVLAAARDPDDPLLHLVLAALLEPLAKVGDFGRFAHAFTSTGAADMKSWRLALLESWVQRESLEEQAAEAALQRARSLRGR
ncbi:MAG: hypothetical protein ACYTCU_02035 [Planctomycetota bacterium]